MKNKLLFSAMLFVACTLSLNVNAQLKVESNGNVIVTKQFAIGTTPATNTSLNLYKFISSSTEPFYGIKSILQLPSSMPAGDSYAIFAHTDASSFSGSGPNNSIAKKMCGIVGEVSVKTSIAEQTFCAGVAGITNNSATYGGIGVFGAIKTGYAMPSWSLGSYAGYFQGPVKVTSTLTAAAVVTTSDERMKQNIEKIESETIHQALLQLRPVSYYFNHSADSILCLFDANTKSMEVQHFGLIAQEVKKLFPNLVYENTDGYMSVNYIEMIPLLLQEIQRLSAEVEELRKEKEFQSAPYREQSQDQRDAQAILYQNIPNPFSDDTEIKYELPSSTQTASLYIYNMNGLQMAEYPISSLGEGNIVVSARSLEAGMYLYSLIADGKVIDTKRMILTK